ncbi:MAG: signal peptide peptidase SppA [Fibrobacter sp.]|jgi:protease-4|nr:signal peptide peptidase SppA [Fibrobacter sp.]
MDLLRLVFSIVGAITCFLLVALLFLLFMLNLKKPSIHANTVLEIDFEKGLIESVPDAFIYRLSGGGQLQITNVVTALDIASKDKRIKGIIAHIAASPFRYADVQEIRDAVIRFRKSGKPAFAFAESFGEAGAGNSNYYLASAFDSIFMQPSGSLGLTGFMSLSPFFKGTLDKLGVTPQLGAREEYKTAKNQFTETEYTDAHRQMSQDIINSVLNRFASDLSSDRKLKEQHLKDLISQGPFSASEALNNGLIDALEYRDQVYDRMRQKIGKRIRFLYLTKYLQRFRARPARGKAVALIHGDGAIVQGKSSYNPLSGEMVMGARTICAAFRAAIKDKSVGVIIFRVNSPGGSHIGSDMIWRETVRAQKAGKPVIVTMGAVAGSGGYFVAMNAEKIIANPSTITGSIGVVSGKFVTEGFYNKLGVTTSQVTTSPNATIWSPTSKFTEEQWNYIEQSLDTVYHDFVSKVASGRKLPLEKVKEIAGGRIYTGDEALRLGLVDTLGGFYEAIQSAKKILRIPDKRMVLIKKFPKRPSFWERFFGKSPDSSEDTEVAFQEDVSLSGSLLSKLQKAAGMITEEFGALKMEIPVVY